MRSKRLAAVSAAALLLCSCSSKKNESVSGESTTAAKTTRAAVTGDITVTFLDVGKADAIIIQAGEEFAVIDCGEKGDGKDIAELIKENGGDSVSHLIITHYDQDHVGGAAKVIKELNVENVYAPDYGEDSKEVEKLHNALEEKDMELQLLTSDITFSLGEAEFTVYAPKLTDYGDGDDNDFSLVTRVDFGESSFIFAGDAMEARLNEIMDIGDCDLLKVPYHGRRLDNTDQFLDAVTPEYAVVCTSAEEFDSKTQLSLSKRDIAAYATCYNGTITAVSDGNSITVTSEK